MKRLIKINRKRWQHCFCIRRAEIFNVRSKTMIYNSAVKKIQTLTKTLVRFRSGQGIPDDILLLLENVDSLKLHLLFTTKSLNSVYCCLDSSGPEWNIWSKRERCRAEAAAKALVCYVRDKDTEPVLTQAGRKVEFLCLTFRQRTLIT